MKSKRYLLLFCAFLLLLAACSKSNAPRENTGSGTGIGAVRPVGTVTGPARTAVIGPGGGTISSADNKLQLSIPAGALTGNTTIGIAAITNTSDAALVSYRLTPHLTFAKPVTITISYAEYVDTIGGGCGAGIGFQDEEGIWQFKTNRIVDESKQTVSVQTDHFSDWALLTPFRLLPGYSLIAPNEEVILKVGAYVKIGPGAADPCSFLSSGKENVAVEEYYVVPNHGIEKWISIPENTAGAGKLTRLERGASYVASNYDHPDINPATILAFFPNGVVPLSAKIEVRPVSLGVFITVANTTYVYDKAYAYGSAGDIGVVWEKDVNGSTFHGGMAWTQPGTGVRNWSDDNQFLWSVEGGSPRIVYQSYWDDGLKISGGAVNIVRYGAVGEIVEGTFSISNAGVYKEDANGDIEYIGVKPITGRFRVIRK